MGRIVVTVAVVGDAICIELLLALEDRLIFFPTKGGRVTGTGVDVALRTADRVRLHARYIEHPAANHTLLYLHASAGNLSNRSDLLEQLARFLIRLSRGGPRELVLADDDR